MLLSDIQVPRGKGGSNSITAYYEGVGVLWERIHINTPEFSLLNLKIKSIFVQFDPSVAISVRKCIKKNI